MAKYLLRYRRIYYLFAPMFRKLSTFITHNRIASVVIVLGLILGGYLIFSEGANLPTDLITVARGDITESVIVTGNTKPVATIDLAFQTSGRIASISASVGSTVVAGQIIATEDVSKLAAQLKEAQAGVEAAQAKLDALKNGARPEDIQITQTTLDKAIQDLANDYNGVLTILNDA